MYPELVLLDHMVILFLIIFFLWNLHTVFHMAVLICIPTNCVKGFPFLYIQQLLSLVFFIMAIPHRAEEIAPCGFDLPFSDD